MMNMSWVKNIQNILIPEAVKVLLKNGANPNSKDENLNTALHLAARFGNTEIVELLLKYDIDIDALNDAHNSALHIGTDVNHNEVVKTLLINGANANLLDDALYSAFSNSLGETRMYIL